MSFRSTDTNVTDTNVTDTNLTTYTYTSPSNCDTYPDSTSRNTNLHELHSLHKPDACNNSHYQEFTHGINQSNCDGDSFHQFPSPNTNSHSHSRLGVVDLVQRQFNIHHHSDRHNRRH
ncbi:hypothetical protein INS49_012166 [Diaporthe citri]|uniref:uncharacterized protein n=1 Tax=Diaporthe citri TaxID=83186 RepID=UPI001C825D67|nr:uncharacterized protein INS49_012166 [Diaporthe citri]KAG6358648.1 hypothetical protein INS49_012166 [Diaporthe citri]